MNNYNTRLETLRNERSLSLKEAAKGIGISRWTLYFYENGYFRPTKKALAKIEKFYNAKVSITGDDAYPAPTKEKAFVKKEKKSYRTKRIVYGAVSAAILTTIITGVVLFNRSTQNVDSFYGETYNRMREETQNHGVIGHDLATALPYHYVNKDEYAATATMIFYQTDNMLYFNECSYSTSVFNEFGFCRYHFSFGSNLGIDSNKANFTFGSSTKGTFFSCSFRYNAQPIEKVNDLNIIVKGELAVTEEMAIKIINKRIKNIEIIMSALLSEYLGESTSFVNDFLPAREQGRIINFGLQLAGLALILPGIFAFFIVFSLFLKSLTANIRPRLVSTDPLKSRKKKRMLPKDLRIDIGVPDFIIIAFGKFLQYGSLILFALSFIARLGIQALSFLAVPELLMVLKMTFFGGIFLEHFIMIGRIRNATTLFKSIIFNLGIFLFIATIETVIIGITNAWGYNFASLIYNYVPSNVYQVIAVHYLIFLFLFFQPSFLSNRLFVRILWHSLSFIPLGFLIATYFLSNAYELSYGVQANIFVNFWFPNGFLILSIVCVLFMYSSFALRLYFERKYGKYEAQYFFYGDRFIFFENVICSAFLLIAGLIDFAFFNNQYAYYLGLDGAEWILALIPFIILCKYSPNNQQVFMIKDYIDMPKRMNESST